MKEYTIIFSKMIKKNMYKEDRSIKVFANNYKEVKEIALNNLDNDEVYTIKEKVIYEWA